MTPSLPEPREATGAPSAAVRLIETRFEAMAGFEAEDHLDAYEAFRRSAQAVAEKRPALRVAVPPGASLVRLCDEALAMPRAETRAEARRFFETVFTPYRIEAAEPGFITGYYEPEVAGSPHRTADFTAPVLRRPPGVGRIAPGVADDPFADRASIEASIGTAGFEPVVWLRDWVEVFFVHVQGSARVRFADGRTRRLVYDGRNGQPYTSIGRLLAERAEILAGAMSLERLKAWIRDHGQEIGEPGRALMQANRSYIFFRLEAESSDEGPIGGAGLPLRRLRSIAVDRALWPYGTPFFIDAAIPWRTTKAEPFRRLMIAEDTGSAILGPARADLFFGSGPEAGARAGDIRHRAGFTVLLRRGPEGPA